MYDDKLYSCQDENEEKRRNRRNAIIDDVRQRQQKLYRQIDVYVRKWEMK